MAINLDRFDDVPAPGEFVNITIRDQQFKLRRETVEEYFDKGEGFTTTEGLKKVVLETVFEQGANGKPNAAGKAEFARWWDLMENGDARHAKATYPEIRKIYQAMQSASRGELKDTGETDPLESDS